MKALPCKLLLISFFISLLNYSCSNDNESFIISWTNEIKRKIREDSGRTPDSISRKTINDSVQFLTFYLNDSLLKKVRLNPKTRDTSAILYFSGDMKFVLASKTCFFLVDRQEEVLGYKSILDIGFHQFFFCNGRIKREGFSYNRPVGVWKEYDSAGTLINSVDYGDLDKLNILKSIHYYR